MLTPPGKAMQSKAMSRSRSVMRSIMAELQPLRGFRYNTQTVGDLADVITPPYDIISPLAQAGYYARNPYNVIRLELAQAEPGDDALNNVYTRAAATFSEWRLQDVLEQELTPGYYCYQQNFTYGGQNYRRTSLLARVRIEPWEARVVLPHENTLAKAREDRLQLLRACNANFSPILSLYDDPQGRLRRLLSGYAENAPIRIRDDEGVEHRLSAITDAQQVALIQDFFAQRQLYIADGHHRYITALNYRDEIDAVRGPLPPESPVNFVLMALIDVEDPGMLVLPTHRLLTGLDQEQINRIEQLGGYFHVSQLASGNQQMLQAQLAQAGEQQPALLFLQPDRALLLTPNEAGLSEMQASGHTPAWNELGVALAQHLLLDKALGISADDVAGGRYVSYTHNDQQAFEAVQRGDVQVAVLLNSTPLRQVCAVAQADDRMPQKSTYIYPKLITGLVINPLW
jgi:uncharacterized protein (DUF1015 family)